MDYKYFKLTDAFREAKKQVDSDYSAACKKAVELAESYGAKSAAQRHGAVIGFVFDGEPAGDFWRKPERTEEGDKCYAPKVSTKQGKEIMQKMAAIRIPTHRDVLALVDLKGHRVMGEATVRGVRVYSPHVEEVGDTEILCVPVSKDYPYSGHELLEEISLSDYYTLKAKAAA